MLYTPRGKLFVVGVNAMKVIALGTKNFFYSACFGYR